MSLIGNGNLKAQVIRTMAMVAGADDNACMRLAFTAKPTAGEALTAIPYGATITIDADGGGTAPTILITILRRNMSGDAAATSLTYTITGVAVGSGVTAWSGTSPTFTANAGTLYEVIALLRLIPGLTAFALHAPHMMPMNTETQFVDQAATAIAMAASPSEYTPALYRDESAFVIDTDDEVAWMRIGLLEVRDRNVLGLLQAWGVATGVTSGFFRIYRDDFDDYPTPTGVWLTDIDAYDVLVSGALSAANTFASGYINAPDAERALMCKGPLIVEAHSTNLTACNIKVSMRQESLGV